jgi:cation:H+ antiporter
MLASLYKPVGRSARLCPARRTSAPQSARVNDGQRNQKGEKPTLLTIAEFALALVVILFGAAFFTNAVEILGSRLGMQQGAVGSLLAAVGTALPESMIAVVAILEPVIGGGDREGGAEIGVGAILGAPFMLATLALFVVGAAALGFKRRRSQGATLDVDEVTIGRDIGFFLVFFALAAGVGLLELPFWLKVVVAGLLVVGYAWYARLTLGSGGHLEEVPERLLFLPRRPNPPLLAAALQTLVSLGVIVVGAHFFVDAVKHAAVAVGLPAGLIALILAPLATELPEKFNSIFWVMDGKDTLALGNMTGAMIFQSTIPVTFGILFTRWDLGALDLFATALALASGGLVYILIRRPGKLKAWHLMVGGAFYLAFVVGAVLVVV